MPFGRRFDRIRSWVLDSGLVFLFSAILLLPLWRLNYSDNWKSIEATFIADGRMLRQNWPHHLWQPLWYCGTRADYVYPPGLSSGVAIFSWALHASYAHAYHILIALFYAGGIVAVYLWVRTATGSRRNAFAAAAGLALLSPCFLFIPEVRIDSQGTPWRLHVLMEYGEGPHISSLSVLPLVWFTAWRWFRNGGTGWLLLCAASAAAVVTLNFYGATSLGITYVLLIWSLWLERRDWRIFRDGFCIAALACGLTAWWLVPSFLNVTARNLRLVSPPGNAWSLPVFCGLCAVYVGATVILSRYRPVKAYTVFLWSGLGFLGAFTLGYRWFGFQVTGSSARLLPEFDVFAILCGLTLLERLWRWPRLWLIALVLVLAPSYSYLSNPYREFRPDRGWQQQVAYQTARRLQEHYPNQRVYVNGTIRFWLNAWFNSPQADGGSMQGILNPRMSLTRWRILQGDDSQLALAWLQALGVDVLVVPGAGSQEPYKEFQHPDMYAGWPLLEDDGEGNRFYRVPRRTAGMVRLVNRAALESAQPIPADYEKLQLEAYAKAIEAAPPGGDDASRVHGWWTGSDEWNVEAEVQPGESILFQENFDPYWRAQVDGREQALRRDALGFMVLDALPGKHSIQLRFETPAEMTVGRLLTAASLALMAMAILARRKTLFDPHLS